MIRTWCRNTGAGGFSVWISVDVVIAKIRNRWRMRRLNETQWNGFFTNEDDAMVAAGILYAA